VHVQVLISLCVAMGLAAAAPQLDLPGVQRAAGVNQDTLVSEVVTALEPSIAAAVANALRSIQSSSASAKASASAAKFSGPTAAVAEATARPEYNFEFKVLSIECFFSSIALASQS
jgi:hypothetical protein